MDSAETVVSETSKPEVAILFFGVALILGALCKQVFARTPVPYTVALLMIGIILGALDQKLHNGLRTLGESIQIWANIEPGLILFIFLPALLFESSMSMEIHQVRKCLLQMSLLAGPGVLVNTVLLGAALKYAFPYSWSWSLSLTLGGLLSATDPVAVVALLKELGASKKLNTIIEGESLMNDGTGIVVFRLFYRIVFGSKFNFLNTIVYFLRVSFGGVAMGIGFGLAAIFWLGFVFNDTLIEITITLSAAYMVYFVSEEKAAVSGVIGVMFLGVFFAAFGNTAFTGENKKSLHYFWEMVGYMANTLIFILAGVIIAEVILRNTGSIDARDWAYLLVLYVFVQLARVVVVGLSYPLLKYLGYGIDWKEATVMTWAGLRGAVALTLALTVERDQESHIDANGVDHSVSPKNRARFVFLTGGVVFLTLVVNGSTTKRLLSFLGMDRLSESKMRILECAQEEMRGRALQAYVEVGEDDEELGPAHWPSVQKFVAYLRKGETAGTTDPFGATISDETNEMYAMRMRDARVRFLRGVQAAYWDLLDQDRLSQVETRILIESVDCGLDDEDALGDWDELRPYVRVPPWLRFLQSIRRNNPYVNALVNRLVVCSLERACALAAGYLRAHHTARNQLQEFLRDDSLTNAVIKESLRDEKEARAFLEEVAQTFPQVLTSVKTRQVAFHVLGDLQSYIEALDHSGLIDTKEIGHLHDTVRLDLKKLKRAPLLIRPKQSMGLLRNTPLGSHVPVQFENMVRRDGKERTFLKGAPIYREGSATPVGGGEVHIVYTVDDVSTSHGERHVSHFVLGAGAILGLYEALAGNRRKLTTAVADSVCMCYVVDRNRLAEMVRTDVYVAEFLWKESAVLLCRLVLPRALAHLSLQEIRKLIMEKGRLKHFDPEEVVQIRYDEVLVLLEGTLRNAGGRSLIAPMGLDPDISSLFSGALDTVRLKAELQYVAETPSRVLFIPVGTDRGGTNRSHEQLPATAKGDLGSRRSFSDNQLLAAPGDDKRAGLLDKHRPTRHKSSIELPMLPADTWQGPEGAKAADVMPKVKVSPASEVKRAEESGVFLPRSHSREQVRPLAGLGVNMPLMRMSSRARLLGERRGGVDESKDEFDDLEANVVEGGEDLFNDVGQHKKT
ncbi:Na+/H+ antiporter [Klebsormidium nitens]|uniref:Na+/H+ antiporter n=1 Tax=Klebsormidium nitens TaxID=105231 RepID=A0A1Y1III6_KLENI|nr:Na+/H+ antiporter [Klebsormidium nitens]|eukprot:GAQ89279.1 Na+/H+ antiporter [Klebsormidium nitens]